MSELVKKLEENQLNKQKLLIEQGLLLEKAMHSDDPSAIIKANAMWEQVKPKTFEGSKSYIFDPQEFSTQFGYRDKPVSISFNVLRRMSQVPIIRSIISTRIEQVAAFCEPQPDKYSVGFIIRKKHSGINTNTKDELSRRDRLTIKQLTDFILNCGQDTTTWQGDNFDSFIRKFVTDSLTLDQGTFEIIRSKKGTPLEFIATDAATFRLADNDESNEAQIERNGEPSPIINGYKPAYVQIYQQQIVSEFYPWELCFGIRNPSTSIHSNGYGQSELETLVNTITSMLYSDSYNQKFFTTGSAPKGILKVTGNVNESRLQEFRQQWLAQVAGVQNAWKTPVIEGDKVEWIDLQKNNKDMEFSKFQEYLIKLSCASYKIDPSEIGFPMNGSSGQSPLFEGNNEGRIKYSKDKGLKPLLKFIQSKINKYIINPLAPEFEFIFAGIDAETAKDELEADIKRVASFVTVNELRKKYEMEPIDGGDTILSPVWNQAKQMSMSGDPESNAAVYAENGGNEDNYKADEEDPFAKSFNDWWKKESIIDKEK